MSLFPEVDAAHAERVAAEALAHAAADDRLRERQADFTPRPTSYAVMSRFLGDQLITHGSHVAYPAVDGSWLFKFSTDLRPLRILDINAGACVWGSVARQVLGELGIPVHITAVEYDPSEREFRRLSTCPILLESKASRGANREILLRVKTPSDKEFFE